MLTRETLNLTSPGEFDSRVAALLSNIRYGTANDGVPDINDFVVAAIGAVPEENFGRERDGMQ